MKKEELQSEEHSKSVLNEPVAQYYSRINVPKRIYEDIRVSIEQADNGFLIPILPLSLGSVWMILLNILI